uniref:Uncharacterized protein n=1 Tax=Arundo donax TaxID=35708 RepID=A0A0A9PW88_ARUDO
MPTKADDECLKTVNSDQTPHMHAR